MIMASDDHQKDDEGAKGKNNLPKNIRLRATFFMNIRPSAGIPVSVVAI